MGATQGDNFRDNTEQIYIEKPVFGKTYTITVNHKGSLLKGDIQYYALIVSGVSSTPCQLSASIASAGNTSLCKGAVKLLTNSGTNLSYVWSWNGQQIPLSNANSYNPKVAGNYTVTVTQGKCSATSPMITVENAQTPVISSDNGSNICNANINLSVKNLTGTGIKYQWLRNNSNISKATNATLSISEVGNYSVKTTQNGCTATSLPFIIASMGNNVVTKPSTGKYLLISGRSTIIQAVLTDNFPYTFQWFKDGVKIPNANQASITINQAGKYTVQMTLGKCTSTSGAVEFVKVSNARVMSFDDFTQDTEPETLTLSPNPTNEWLKIQYNSKQNLPNEPSIEIINSLGLSILSDKLEKIQDNSFTKEINVKSLSTGMYFVRIIDGEKVLVKKFIRGE